MIITVQIDRVQLMEYLKKQLKTYIEQYINVNIFEQCDE